MEFRYLYGMRLRPSGIGCQPDGYEHVHDFRARGRYWSIVAYDRQLTEDECDHYDMDLLGAERRERA